MNIIIRKYNESDINDIEKLGKKLHNNFRLLLNDYSNCIVCEDNNLIIGFITYSIMYERSEIIDIIIDEKHRCNGYGHKLVEEVIKIAENNKCDNITLEVSKLNNNAINLYKDSGFEIVAVRKNYYNNSDGYLMKKDLR